MRKILLIFCAFILSSCSLFSSYDEELYMCPVVSIPRQSSYAIKELEGLERFKIEMTGYEGYCYYDERVKADKAVVAPVFQIKRLHPTDETDIHFSYFVETVNGPPEFLGKKTYHAKVSIPRNVNEFGYKAQSSEVRLPNEENPKLDIIMGLSLSKSEKNRNQKTLDIDFNYEE